jgi:hypothetical protein
MNKMENFGRLGDTYVVVGRPSNLDQLKYWMRGSGINIKYEGVKHTFVFLSFMKKI